MLRIAPPSLLLLVLGCAYVPMARAQASFCSTLYEYCIGDDYSLVVGSTCFTDFPTCQSCNAKNNRCAPPGAFNETCLSCNRARTAQGSEPIDFATGNTYITESDVSVPGVGGGLSLVRTWNSRLPASQTAFSGMFGVNWRSNFEERLIFNSPDRYLKWARGDGSVWSFGVVTIGSPTIYQTAAPANDTTTLTTGASYWTLVLKSGEKRRFDNATGLLLAIIDRNGNTTQLTYDSGNRLATVADAAGRHLNFSYASPSSNLVTGVSSDVGISLSYLYNAQGRLTKVTNPDNTFRTFDYDANSFITAVKDSEGKVLESHTYDSLGRGITGSRANGIGSITVTYPQ